MPWTQRPACVFVGDFQNSPALTSSAQMFDEMKAHPIALPVLNASESQRVQAFDGPAT